MRQQGFLAALLNSPPFLVLRGRKGQFLSIVAKSARRGSGLFQVAYFLSLPTEFEVTAYGGDFGITMAPKLEAGPMWSMEIP